MSNDPRVARRTSESSFQHLDRIFRECTFESKDPDDRVFGGSHTTAKANAMNELKNFDRRIATPFHIELTMNVLKSASFYTTPNGKMFTNDFVEGRIVGLCLISETARSVAFLPYLKQFCDQHPNDFVPVVISMAKHEMEKDAHGHGLNYLSHMRGSGLVKRDLGHLTGRWLPMPRLIIVDGTTGFTITNSGYTAIKVRPETCFQEWLEGESGHSYYDFPLGWVSG